MNDPHRKRLAHLLTHARGMMRALDGHLDEIEAAFRDEDSDQEVSDALDQLALVVFELANDARNITLTARRWNTLYPDGSDADDGYRIDRDGIAAG